jgi:hypothetical protein
LKDALDHYIHDDRKGIELANTEEMRTRNKQKGTRFENNDD